VVSRIVDRRAVAHDRRVSLCFGGDAGAARRPLGALRRAGVAEVLETPLLAELLGREAAPRWRDAVLDSHASVQATVAEALQEYAARLVRNQAVLAEGADPEGVHQTRVACRRLRSALRTFAPLLDPAWSEALNAELRSLADALGRVRDAEVLLIRLQRSAEAHGIAPATTQRLLSGLVREREEGRAALLRRIAGDAHREQLDHLLAAARHPQVLPEEAERRASTSLMPLVTGSWKKLRRRMHGLPDLPSDTQLHSARIKVKHCRYAVMAVAPLVGDDAVSTAGVLGELQDVLGEQHDAVVAAEWLRQFGDGDLAFAAGTLFSAERALADRSRHRWRKRWQAVDRRDTWRWAH
jgi:CHAD domain-containing protein